MVPQLTNVPDCEYFARRAKVSQKSLIGLQAMPLQSKASLQLGKNATLLLGGKSCTPPLPKPLLKNIDIICMVGGGALNLTFLVPQMEEAPTI